jgi:hypothetical protein
VEITFTVPATLPFGGINDVPHILLTMEETNRGVLLLLPTARRPDGFTEDVAPSCGYGPSG